MTRGIIHLQQKTIFSQTFFLMVNSMVLNDISTFDWIIAAILLFFLLRGLCIGFVRQLAATAALLGSWWAAGEYASQVMPYVKEFIDQPGMVFFASFGILFLFSALLLTLIGQLLNKMLEVSLLGWADRICGGLLGIARGALVAALLHLPVTVLLPASHPLFAKSLTMPYLNQGADMIRQFIRDDSMRNDLRPRPPEQEEQPHGPVQNLPSASPEQDGQRGVPQQMEPIPAPEQQYQEGMEPALPPEQQPQGRIMEGSVPAPGEPVIIPYQAEPESMEEQPENGMYPPPEPR
jgi:membrane protein required for colicin V production